MKNVAGADNFKNACEMVTQLAGRTGQCLVLQYQLGAGLYILSNTVQGAQFSVAVSKDLSAITEWLRGATWALDVSQAKVTA